MSTHPDYIHAVGCLLNPGASSADYLDYLGHTYPLMEVRDTLKFGNFPTGLILADDFGRRGIVQGRVGQVQTLAWVEVRIGA